MNRSAALLLFCCYVILASPLFGQNVDESQTDNALFFHPNPYPNYQSDDLQLLIGFDIEKKFLKRFEVGLNYQTRIDNFMSNFQAALIEGSLQYSLGKYVVFKTAFRQGWVTETDFHGWSSGTGTRQRLMFATYFKWKKKDFPIKFQVRLRYDNEWATSRFRSVREFWVLRPRLQVEWNASKLVDPYVLAEPFFDFKREYSPYTLTRVEVGLQWKFGKIAGLNSFYRLETIANTESNIHMLGIMWNMKFK